MKFIPHPYQEYCVHRIIDDPAVGLFLDMGLGKTVITLTAINELKYNRFQANKILVIAPKKVAEATWSREAEKWDHLQHLRVVRCLGPKRDRMRALASKADVYVINRENVTWLVDYYRNGWPFDMVVIDELSSFKSSKAKRFKALSWVRPKMRRVVGLTGTPSPNSLEDLWAEVYLLDEGKRLYPRIGQFRSRYFNPGMRGPAGEVYSYEPKTGSGEAIEDAISDICISMKADDYLQLPDLVSTTVPVQLDVKARKAYDEMERTMLLEVDDTEIDAGSAAALSVKLLQLANGAVYDETGGVARIHDCKIEALLETVEALEGKPALCFYNFKHDRNRILAALPDLRVRCYTGPEDGDAWNRGEIDILLAHPASTAYGLNLQQGGNHIIWFGLNWSLELYQQANARLYRQGQKERVIIHHLVAEGTRDEDVMEALEAKGDVQDALLESLKVRIRKARATM